MAPNQRNTLHLRRDRLIGTLLGTAVGDALGLPFEGERAGRGTSTETRAADRFHFLGRWGFVSDDTEQAALVAEALLAHPTPAGAARAFQWGLAGWFLRLPWGIGFGTLRACLKILLGFRKSGVASAGNGAAMRAAIVGVAFPEEDEQETRDAFGIALAETTHADPRAVAGACFVADVAAHLSIGATPREAVSRARERSAVRSPAFAAAVGAAEAEEPQERSGFVNESVPFAVHCLLHRDLAAAAFGGGDSDTNAAILGAWLGASLGAEALARAFPVDALFDGVAFAGPSHLRALGAALAETPRKKSAFRWSALAALARNLALYPVVLAHAVAVLLGNLRHPPQKPPSS